MPSFEQSTGTLLKQQQSTVLSQKQLRSLELLHLPLPALESRLAQELTENPVLEEGDLSRDETDNGGAENVSPADEPEDEALLAEKAAEADEWSDDLPLPGERETPLQAGENWDLLGNSPAPGPTLREILLMEIDTTEIPEELIPAVICIGESTPTAERRWKNLSPFLPEGWKRARCSNSSALLKTVSVSTFSPAISKASVSTLLKTLSKLNSVSRS